MRKKLRITPENSIVMKQLALRYQEAKLEYGKACSDIAKLRLLADHPNAFDQDIIRYAKARKVFTEQCRKFQQERAEFFHRMKMLELRATSTSLGSDEDYLNAIEDAPMTQLRDMTKQAVIAEEFSSGKYNDLIEETKAKMRVKDQVLSDRKEDPTFGDFDPI